MEDLDVDRRVLLKCNSRKRCGSMDWIDLAQVRDRWRAVVIAIVNIREMAGSADDMIACPGLQPWVKQLVLDFIYILGYL